MKKKKIYRKAGIFLAALMLCLGFSMTAFAEKLPCRSATATGVYSNPSTGVIEDSGGKENEALGQSMVANVVDPDALIEENPSGGYYVSLRFHLMNNLSKFEFSIQEPGDSEWKTVTSEQTASGDDQGDLRLTVDSEKSIIRTECYVEAMGRNVIFYVTLSDFEDGNRGGFAQIDSDSTDELQNVTGLTTGGGTSVSSGISGAEAVTLTTDTDGSVTVKPQELNLSAGVWWMLFVTVFCANILASLVIMGVKLLLQQLADRKNQENTELEEEPESMELSEDDWEDFTDEE